MIQMPVSHRSSRTPSDAALVGTGGRLGRLRRLYADRHQSAVPVSRQGVTHLFSELATTWREETGFSSNVNEIALHPAYQRIISLGSAAVPMILSEMARMPDHWFHALSVITGADPIQESDRGDMILMTRRWLEWGRQTGYSV